MRNPSLNPHFRVIQMSGSTPIASHRFLTPLTFHASPGRKKQVPLCISLFRPGILKKSSAGTLKSLDGVRAGAKRQNENNDNRNTGGSSRNSERHYDSNANENSRSRYPDSKERYGRSTARGRGGRGRMDRPKSMHPGAYKMRDEQTGDLVVVWGVEDDDDIPVPTADDLNWRKTTVAIPGEATEEAWIKAMEDFSGSSGSYSVKGVEQGGRDWTDDLYENDHEDDFEDADTDEDEDETDSDLEERTGTPTVAISRSPRVRLFGRDLWGKSQLKTKTQEKDANEVISEPIKKPAAGTSTGSSEATGLQIEAPVAEVGTSVGYSRALESPSDSIDGVQNSASEITHIIAEVRSSAPKFDKDILEGRRRAIKNGDSVAECTSRTPEIIYKSAEGPTRVTKMDDRFSEGTTHKAPKVDDRLSGGRSKAPQVYDRFSGGTISKAPKVDDSSAAATKKAIRNNDDFAGESSKPSRGSFNPYIIDVSDEDESRSRPKRQQDARKSDFLDQLRLQVTGRKPRSQDVMQKAVGDLTEETHSLINESRIEDKEAPSSSVDTFKLPPMRDLTARDNYDASIANQFYSLKSFKDLGATSEMIEGLAYLQVQRPSQIQAMAFKPILQGKSCIIAEQTGSGKTLAYVAPIVQCLKEEEARTLGKSLSKKPRVLVLVPTGELAAQVLSTFRALSKSGMSFRSVVITGGYKWKTQVESLEGGTDVVVATPGRLLQHLEAGNIQFDNLKSVVLDEVDILFDDEDFSNALQTINKAASIKVQYIHVTATLPVDIHDDLLDRYPDCLSLMGPSLHRTAVGLQEVLVDCSGGETDAKTPESAFINKRTALLQLVEERPVAKTIVFCNKMETCRKVENVLSRYDRSGKKISVLPYHAALSQEARLESLETFMKPQAKERLFLVCTDRASRGIDSLDVEHVVLFDFPRDPSEYVRRVGRTARGAGGTGKVFAFVVGRQVGQARRIMARNDKGEPVHDVPGSRYYYSN